MRSKTKVLTHFSRAIYSKSPCLRPDTEKELADYIVTNASQNLLPRGAGLSYSDSCFNTDGQIIDTSRFNHFIHFDKQSGVVQCQGGVTFKELLSLHPEFIPPVLPGTLLATIAGGIAHDIHGKNNTQEGSLGHHLCWIELMIQGQIIRCSPNEHSALFYATIGGLGLTGTILRVALRLKKIAPFVQLENQRFDSLKKLTTTMSESGLRHDYQVAWLDLLNKGQPSLLSFANHCNAVPCAKQKIHIMPKLPFSLIKSWNIKLFNQFFIKSQKEKLQLSLEAFNNPLDHIAHWNRLYGPKGLIQFQALFDETEAVATMEHLFHLIHHYKATPTLAVLKLFKKPGTGLLSFCKPGFTIAIDFIHNDQAKKAINAMNQWLTEINGRIYLAKDLLLNAEQYQKMYPNQEAFSQVLKKYQCTTHSDLSRRLRITE